MRILKLRNTEEEGERESVSFKVKNNKKSAFPASKQREKKKKKKHIYHFPLSPPPFKFACPKRIDHLTYP